MKKLLICSFAAASLLTLTPTAHAAEQQSPEKTACIHGIRLGHKCVKCELLAKKPAKEQEPKKEKEPTKESEPAKIKEPAKESEPAKAKEPAKKGEPTKDIEPAKGKEPAKESEPAKEPTSSVVLHPAAM